MYIWIGCKLPEDFSDELRAKCLPLGEALGLDMVSFSLPQHISLKISFEATQDPAVILDALEAMLKQEKAFSVALGGLEIMGNILWLTFGENDTLQRLHRLLDQRLLNEFGVRQHDFDKAFAFHSTLFFGQPAALRQALSALRPLKLPRELAVDTFLLGVSESGAAGTYRVVRQIPAAEK